MARARALDLLVGGCDYNEVAALVKVARRTVELWVQETGFGADLEARRREVASVGKDRLRAGVIDSIDALLQVIRNEKNSPSDRIKAATALLDRTGIFPRGETPSQTLNVHLGGRNGELDERIRLLLERRVLDVSPLPALTSQEVPSRGDTAPQDGEPATIPPGYEPVGQAADQADEIVKP